MKIALLADIHGNAAALDAALAEARALGAERLLIAGDLVGYYYEIDRVLELLTSWTWVSVRGNHEEILAAWVRGEDREVAHRRYGSGYAEAVRRLAARDIEFLTQLPASREIEIAGRRALLCHGTPRSTQDYVYPDADPTLWEQFLVGGADIVIYGHTHYPVMQRSGSTCIVNPGSVGQQRDRQPGAAWAMWDTSDHSVALRRTPYDTAPLAAACRLRDPHLPYLAEVLTRC